MTDRNGVELHNGMYVHFRQDDRNPNKIPDHVATEFDGWVFWVKVGERSGLGLFTNDRDNNLFFTDLFFEDDGTPCYELTVE